MYFDELDLNDDLLDALYDMNFSQCTPIQELAIPTALSGKDILASAQTGTGKTAAYLLPILELISRKGQASDKVNALILLPTRELVQQVDQLLNGFAYYMNTSWIAIYGGNDGIAFGQQIKALQLGGDIAIATPGRLISILRTHNIDLSGIEYLVLDEADRMLDIGFYDDIMEIISKLPQKRQTMLFSATYPKEVESLAKKILNCPKKITIAVSKPADGISQHIYFLHENQKLPLIKHIMNNTDAINSKSITFLSSKEKVKEVYRLLKQTGLHVAQMHSDLEQSERSQVMLDFKSGKINTLIATDIVSRGIDINNIDTVINYDVPIQPEDYVHRIGRTARAGANGVSITFVTPKEKHRLDKIEKLIENKIPREHLPEDIIKLAPEINEDLISYDKPKRKHYFYNKNKNNKK